MDRKHLEDLLTDVSFVRWIRGECSAEEKKKWEKWLLEDPEHKNLVKEAKEVILAFNEEVYDIPVVTREWQKLEELIDQEDHRREAFQQRKIRGSLWKSNGLIATALLIVVIFLGVFYLLQYQPFEPTETEIATASPSLQEYRTDFGEKVTFRLSDDSRIVLNANSRIQFSSTVNGELNSTEVWLEGEAWFDITHLEGDQQRTFSVHTDDGTVQVLGTRFAVKTFENETRTVLEEGKIEVKFSDKKSDEINSIIMEPGELALFSSKSEGFSLEKVNPKIYTSWNEDIWFFENTSLNDVGRRMEDTFGVNVIIREELKQKKLSGSIKGTSLEVITEALQKILDAEIDRQNQNIYIRMTEISQQ